MASLSCESDSGEMASTTADEVEESSRHSTTEDSADESTTDTDSYHGSPTTSRFMGNMNLTPKEGKKYVNGLLDAKKLKDVQSDTETKNLLDDIGEDFDEDYLNLQENGIDLDSKMFELSDEQLNYYTNCFLYLLEKTQGFATLQGALQGSDRFVLDFFRKSGLDDLNLSRIWSLSDINEDGFLNFNEFITAMHLVILHLKGCVPIPNQLPTLARPPNTPTRSMIQFDNGSIGAFPNSLADSTSDSSTKIISECISSSSGGNNSQQQIGSLSGGGGNTQQQQQEFEKRQHPLAIIPNKLTNSAIVAPPLACKTSTSIDTKQHSFSDDHLHSNNGGNDQREIMSIAKFSDVPPLLVDSQPTALNAVTTSKILPKFAQLLASSQRGPPPQPPHRDYQDGGVKGHGRSVSLDLKTFSAFSPVCRINKDHKSVDEPHGLANVFLPATNQTTTNTTSTPEMMENKGKLVDRSMQTMEIAKNLISTETQTSSTGTDELSEENLALCIRDLDSSKLSSKERCQLLQRINEQLELERATLMQVRFQVQLRIEEAEHELQPQKPQKASCMSPRSGNKPTTL